MDEAQIRKDLDACLSSELELSTKEWKRGYPDSWPVHRATPLQ